MNSFYRFLLIGVAINLIACFGHLYVIWNYTADTNPHNDLVIEAIATLFRAGLCFLAIKRLTIKDVVLLAIYWSIFISLDYAFCNILNNSIYPNDIITIQLILNYLKYSLFYNFSIFQLVLYSMIGMVGFLFYISIIGVFLLIKKIVKIHKIFY